MRVKRKLKKLFKGKRSCVSFLDGKNGGIVLCQCLNGKKESRRVVEKHV